MIRMKHIAAVALSLTAIANAGAFMLKAKVVDAEGEPQPYVTYSVTTAADSTKAVATGVASDVGVVATDINAIGAVKVTFAYVGMTNLSREFEVKSPTQTIDLGTVTMSEAADELGELVVTAQRPLVIKEIDRVGYDVLADPEVQTSQLDEILRKVPMVSVDPDGTIRVNGSTDFRIYKNGRPNSSYSQNAKDIFKALPASAIKRIEVITDPGSREDAEGSGPILNIITNSNALTTGIMGNIGLNLNTTDFTPMPNVWLSGQVGKVNLSASGGYWHQNKRRSESISHQTIQYINSGNTLEAESYSAGRANMGWWGVEASYEPDTLNLFNVEFNGFAHGSHSYGSTAYNMLSADPAQAYSYKEVSDYPLNKYIDLDFTVNYQHTTHRKGEVLGLSYKISTEQADNEQTSEYEDMVNMPVAYTGRYSLSKEHFVEQTVQADWSRLLTDKMKLDIGGKFIHRDNHSRTTIDYLNMPDGHSYDDFKHLTVIGAVYADWRWQLKKFTLRAGLRYEYSRLSAKFLSGEGSDFGCSLNDYVPNAAISYNIDDAQTIKLSYNRRISRPGIGYLDPAVYESPTSTSQGNPALESAYYDGINLNYGVVKPRFNIDLTVGYSFTNNSISPFQYVVGDRLFSTYENIGHQKSFNVNAYMRWMIDSKSSVTFNGSYTWNQMSQSWQMQDMRRSRSTYRMFLNVDRQLPWKLKPTLYLGMWSGWLQSVYSYMRSPWRNMYYGFNIQRSFLKEDRLTVALGVQCPFGPSTSKLYSYTYQPEIYSRTVMDQRHRISGSLRISWRFGKMSSFVKKTAHSISNDDLSGGSQGGQGAQGGGQGGN